HEPDVPLPALGLDEDGLEPLEELPGVEVAVDDGTDADEPADEFLSPDAIDNAGVELLELVDEDVVEAGAGVLAAAACEGWVRWQVDPAGVGGVFHEAGLHGPLFAAECHEHCLKADVGGHRVKMSPAAWCRSH